MIVSFMGLNRNIVEEKCHFPFEIDCFCSKAGKGENCCLNKGLLLLLFLQILVIFQKVLNIFISGKIT